VSRRITYLDYNATAPLRSAAAAAMAEAARIGGNPSSLHRQGRLARRAVEDARAKIAALVGARPAELIFTGGGTEANNLALGVPVDRVLCSSIEHASVLQAASAAATEIVPVDPDGIIDLAALATMLARGSGRTLVSVMLANNETGAIQPLAEVAALVRRHDALLHADAIQAFGKIAVDASALGIDLLSLSAHKIGGPQGVGALVLREGVALRPQQLGGGQELGRRAGTENVAGIVGFAAAAEAAFAQWPALAALAEWRDELEATLRARVPDLTVWSQAAPRLPNTSCISMRGVSSETQLIAFDLAGFAVSAGAACSSGKIAPSHVLRAMGADATEAGSAVRISLGWATTPAEVRRFAEAWLQLWARLARQPLARDPAAC